MFVFLFPLLEVALDFSPIVAANFRLYDQAVISIFYACRKLVVGINRYVIA